MRLLILSDVHERVNIVKKLSRIIETEDLDLVLIAGDLTYFKNIEHARKVLITIRNTVDTKVLFVPGNCDPRELLDEYKDTRSDILNIHCQIYEHSGYVFYGIGGSGITPFNTIIEFDEEFFRNSLNIVNDIDQDRFILLTHQPIKGFFDEINGEHVGSTAFWDFLARKQPLLWVTGHIHEHSGFTRYGKTTIVHPGPLMKGYYGIIEIRDSEVVVKLDRLT